MSIVNGFKALWRFVVIATVTLSAILVGLSFTPMMRTSNCGGNSSALHRVHSLKNFAAMAIAERHDGSFNFSELSDAELDQLAALVDSSWNREAKFYVASGKISFSETARRIVAVCDTPYSNVPEHRVGIWRWPGPPTHAVAYSDGSTGLISPEEYADINKADFVDVASTVSRKPSRE
ncbi:hypothetical protein [Verrucomicrobium sp. BvORR106]|uniref:hypothetical protein n=1 Tax=Verrucomicrobium sp. BvORR106 TaxID=1403819 RepID=UPI000571AAB3|nr:hypothetical protein [Verrucomicrobium sp. BvORR106]